jgi:hypothetical protein
MGNTAHNLGKMLALEGEEDSYLEKATKYWTPHELPARTGDGDYICNFLFMGQPVGKTTTLYSFFNIKTNPSSSPGGFEVVILLYSLFLHNPLIHFIRRVKSLILVPTL